MKKPTQPAARPMPVPPAMPAAPAAPAAPAGPSVQTGRGVVPQKSHNPANQIDNMPTYGGQ